MRCVGFYFVGFLISFLGQKGNWPNFIISWFQYSENVESSRSVLVKVEGGRGEEFECEEGTEKCISEQVEFLCITSLFLLLLLPLLLRRSSE